MTDSFFFDPPILNSLYACPGRHWELDAEGQPTNKLFESRRRSDLITPLPNAKRRKAPKGPTAQVELDIAADREGQSTSEQKYDPLPIINELHVYVDTWRALPNPSHWEVANNAEFDAEAWDTLNSQMSPPFNKRETGRIVVKVINHLGDEATQVFGVN